MWIIEGTHAAREILAINAICSAAKSPNTRVDHVKLFANSETMKMLAQFVETAAKLITSRILYLTQEEEIRQMWQMVHR